MANKPKQLHYELPPIVEAVIGFHFNEHVEERWIKKLPQKMKKQFALAQEMNEVSFNIGSEPSQPQINKAGLKLTSADQTDVLIVTKNFMSTCRLAPYADWDELKKTAKHNYGTLKALQKTLSVKQVSTRYINRVDIPCGKKNDRPYVELGEYFIFNGTLPQEFEAMTTNFFSVSYALTSQDKDYRYVVTAASTQPALIDHYSILLDIEVVSLTQPPSKAEDFWNFVEKFRAVKNMVFESCLTPKAKALFK